MQVLHGLVTPRSGLGLWAEDSDLAVTSRSQSLRSARPHPFAVPIGGLIAMVDGGIRSAIADETPDSVADRPAAVDAVDTVDALGAVADAADAVGAVADAADAVGAVADAADAAVDATADAAVSRTILLPSLRKSPLDSPELIRIAPRPAPKMAPVLLPWDVPLLVLEPAVMLDLLRRRIDGVRYGATLRHLSRVADFADDLVHRGRVLPTLRHTETGPQARWRPVLQGVDVTAMHTLVTALPAATRAVPDDDDAHASVSYALAVFVDAIARSRISGSLLPPRRGRAPKRAPIVESFLAALNSASGAMATDDPGALETLAAQLASWDEIGRGRVGVAHATFRLRPRDEHADEDAGVGPAEETDGSDGAIEDGDGDLDDEDIVTGFDGDTEARVAKDEQTDTDRSEWQVDFLLQSSEDPSLLIPARQAWQDDGALARWLPHPQELLLAELARAARVYPALQTALRQPRPDILELDADGAYDFLLTAAGALEDAGFGVLLPSWWEQRRSLSLALSASTATDGVVDKAKKFGKEQLMAFDWTLAVGDQMLTDAEIAALAAAKAPLVRLRGMWVVVDPEQLKRGIAFIKRSRKKQERLTAAEILALAAGHGDSDTPLPIGSVRADGWLGDLLDGTLARSIAETPVPEGFLAELRPYQQRGLNWLAFLSEVGLGACLADDMGLGKTVQLLALEAAERSGSVADDEIPGDEIPDDEVLDVPATLLICPMSLVGNWQREAAKFAPQLRVYSHHGRERLSGDVLKAALPEIDLMVTTYGTAIRDIDDLDGIRWRRVVLDEAQAIKNGLSQSARAVKRLPTRHTIALTGTPVENRLAELWSIMDFLNHGLLGSSERFRTEFAVPVERDGKTDVAQRLRTITRPYILRRMKTDPTIIDDLPPKIEVKQYCRLTTEQASLYQSVVDDMMDRIDASTGVERRGNILTAMLKLKQVCNHPALLLHDRSVIGARSGKVTRLEELLDEIISAGDKVLCFTQFTEFAEILLPHLAARFDTDIAYLHGKTARSRRDELVTTFQGGSGPPIFLLSLKAGGTGLNLTAANHVIHLDRWWNPAVEDQATDRAFRIGQRRAVQVRKFVCTGTLEERIDDMIEEKKALANLVISDGENWLTELSTRELRDLFALSKEAVGE